MWYGNYSRKWRAYEVDAGTWMDGAEIGPIQSIDIARDLNSDALQDGSMVIDGERPRGLVRIYIEATGEGSARVAVGTFATDANKRTIDYGVKSVDVALVSVLEPALSAELPEGWYCPKGTDPVRYASDLLRGAVTAPVAAGRSELRTSSTIVAEGNESALTFARAVLDGTPYRILIDEMGVVSVTDQRETHALDASMVYDTITDDETNARTISYKRPFDPSIELGDEVDLELWEYGISGRFEVQAQRIGEECEVDETAVMANGIA